MARSKTFDTIKIENKDGITWVILNRPEKRNAMSPQMHFEMNEALEALAHDADTRVLVITGAGKAFCAGQDLALYFRANEQNPEMRARTQQASHGWRWELLSSFPKPTIAMVNGYCFGGALTQVCACDFAIAANDAVFGLSEVNWGIIPGGVVSWNVTQVMSYRDALYYAVTGDPFDGRTAERIRFVNFAVPKRTLKRETVKLANKLMLKSPNAVRFTKEAIRAVRRMDVGQARDYLAVKNIACKATDTENGRVEGMRQFLDEKTYRPGLSQYDRGRPSARAKAQTKAQTKARTNARTKTRTKAQTKARTETPA